MLDDEAIARYARQIVVPGIGAAGQEKLLASTVLLVGNERGQAEAALYLRAAGVRVVRWSAAAGEQGADVVLVADAATLDAPTRLALVKGSKPICWYVADETGFTSGVHPAAPLPSPASARAGDSRASAALHDAAACETASVACAILIGLHWRSGPFRFEV